MWCRFFAKSSILIKEFLLDARERESWVEEARVQSARERDSYKARGWESQMWSEKKWLMIAHPDQRVKSLRKFSVMASKLTANSEALARIFSCIDRFSHSSSNKNNSLGNFVNCINNKLNAITSNSWYSNTYTYFSLANVVISFVHINYKIN